MRKSTKKAMPQNQPMKLTKEQQKNPLLVFDAFFDNYYLEDVREVLWEWLTAGLTNDNGIFQNSRERSNLIFLYQHVESLAEAAYLILQDRKAGRRN